MSVVYIDRTIDCSKDNFKSEKVTGYEHGVKVFRFKPLNGNIPIDLSDCTGAAYVGTKSDGKIIGNACKIKDNKILLPLTLQMTTAEGDLKGHIEVYFASGTLKFFGVDFEVFPSPETAEIESTDEFTMLENAIAQAKNAYQIAVEKAFEGVIVADVSDITNVTTTVFKMPNEDRALYDTGEPSPTSIAVNSKHLIMDNADKGISVWSLKTPAEPKYLGCLNTGTPVCSVYMTEDGRTFAGTAVGEKYVGLSGSMTMYRGL